MERRSFVLRGCLLLSFALLLASCVTNSQWSVRATARPIVRITPGRAQNVEATAAAFTGRAIPTPTPAGYYVVRPGDTLSKIADDYAMTVDEIMALNNISDPNSIQAGQRLLIEEPAASATAASTEGPASSPVASTTTPGPATSPPPVAPSLEASPSVTATQKLVSP